MAYFRKRLGRWRAHVERAGVTESKTFDTKAEAESWARVREHELLTFQRKARAGAWTLAEAFRKYAEEVSPRRRGARWERIRLAKLGKDAALSSHTLKRLTSAHLAEWRDRRLTEVSPASVAREMALIRAVLKRAVKEWEWIAENPMLGVEIPQEPPPRDRRISDDEATKLCLALGYEGGTPENASQRVALMFRFALETAMRSGEIVGMTWKDTRLKERFVKLPRTKNGEARSVPLSKEAVRILELLPREGQSVWGVNSALRDALFRKARDRAQMKDLRFHDTRHEAITRLARKIDVLDLARMIGHRDLGSLRTYYNATATEIAKRLD